MSLRGAQWWQLGGSSHSTNVVLSEARIDLCLQLKQLMLRREWRLTIIRQEAAVELDCSHG